MDVSVWFGRSLLAIATLVALAPAIPLANEAPPAGLARLQLSFLSPVQLVPESRDVSGLRLSLFFGKNADVSGLDIAGVGSSSRNFAGVQLAFFANGVNGKATGVQFAAFNFVEGNVTGAQLAPMANSAKGTATGVQASLLLNGAERLYGAQIGGVLMNVAREGGTGVQIGVSNFDGGKFTGLQVGLIGSAYRSNWSTLSVTGVQIGILNLVNGSVTGLQVGGLNAVGSKEGSFTGVQIGALNLGGANCKGLQLGVFNACRDMYGVQIGLINFIREGAVSWLPIANAKF